MRSQKNESRKLSLFFELKSDFLQDKSKKKSFLFEKINFKRNSKSVSWKKLRQREIENKKIKRTQREFADFLIILDFFIGILVCLIF